MSQATSMKLNGSRSLNCVVLFLEWSNKMDLIAIGNDKGEVIVQRLNWQKIVTFPSPGEGIQVCSLSWQLDEPILAVGYSNGKVALLDAEREELISGLSYEESIAKVHFSKVINVPDYRNNYRKCGDISNSFSNSSKSGFLQPRNDYEIFLPPLPVLSGCATTFKSSHERKSFAHDSPCFLVVLLKSGKVHLLLLGALKTGTIDIAQHVEHADDFLVYDVRLSYEFNALYALVRDGNQLKMLHFKNNVLQEYISPLLHLATHCANILELKNYINDTIQCMSEAWDTVLMEMDNKLTKYANQQAEGSTSADFLELLVCGYATLEIEEFLMDELTEKGVKKLATSVDLSCSTMQNLVAKPLRCAANNMFYFLNTTKGLSRINYFFEPLLSLECSEIALRTCAAFLLKIQELQQVIDQCSSDLKLFFRWLCVTIIRLRQQDVPEEFSQLTPEDTIYLAEFLNSFEDNILENDDGTITKRKFNLEKVGQYLQNRNLHQIMKPDAHQLWNKLLEENECLRKSSLLFPHDKQSSLIQERDRLLQSIDEVFKKPSDSITNSFELDVSINCCMLPPDIKEDFVRCSYYSNDTLDRDYFLTTISLHECLVLEFDKSFREMKSTRIQLQPTPFTSLSEINPAFSNLTFVDVKFYNEHIVSLLLKSAEQESKSTHYFLQFPLDIAKHNTTSHTLVAPKVNLFEFTAAHSFLDTIDNLHLKNLESECTRLAVTGSRKVAAILSDNCTKMTIFEMEIEDDEDETEMSHTSLLEISKESTE